MKRIVMFLMSTVTAVVLLLGYHTSTSSKAAGGETAFVSTARAGSAVAPSTGQTSSAQTSSVTQPTVAGTAPVTSSSASVASSTAPTTSSVGSTSTVTGAATDTRWGPVQVQLTLVGGKITAVSMLQYPNNNGRDQEINAYALPVLVQETISAQNAKIDMVSGATVTSEGYLTSLQSALDQAGL